MEDEVAALRAEVARLNALLRLTPREAGPPGPAQSAIAAPHIGHVTAASQPAAKVALFLDLFATRSDVHAVRWENSRTGRSGWMPATRGRWRKGLGPGHPDLLPLTPRVVAEHLTGTLDLGLYSIAPGDNCRWLAADFDGPFALLDALAYLKAARAAGVPAVLEVSRSGQGAHAWVFFAEPVPAGVARTLGFGLLREAMGIRGRMNLGSYDRFFPSQDYLPAAGFGNLIAAPLQGRCRTRGTTVFLDLATMEPHPDQWALLSSVDRMTAATVARLAQQVAVPQVGHAVRGLHTARASRIQQPAPEAVRVRVAATLTVTAEDLTPAMGASLRHAASIRNPEFDLRQRLRRSTWDVPRFIVGYDETVAGDLVLPRGLLPLIESLAAEQGSQVEVTDERVVGVPRGFSFSGQLRADQAEALVSLEGHDMGVLVAPPGSGKTVIACAYAGRLGVPTLVLVDRTALAEQWRTQLMALLGVRAGQLGGGRRKRRGTVDIATVQTLARRDDLAEVTAEYGLVVVDECHHVPAATVERVLRQIPARRWLGLTATPTRRDGLDEMISWHLGPVRHIMEPSGRRAGELPLGGWAGDEPPKSRAEDQRVRSRDAELPTDGQAGESGLAATSSPNDGAGTHVASPPIDAVRPEPVLVLHDTDYRYLGDAQPSEPGGMAAIYRDLVADDERLRLVAQDVREALARGRSCLVLSQWKQHVFRLADALRAEGTAEAPTASTMHRDGALESSAARAATAGAAAVRVAAPEPVVLVGGMGVRARAEAMARLNAASAQGPVLLIATGPLIGEGFDLPVLDTLFLAAPVSFPGRLVQYVGRVMRPWAGKSTAEVHDYVDVNVPVLRSSLAKRAPGYLQLGFPDPRRM